MTRESRVAIIGYGAVGRAMESIFPGATLYDPHLGMGTKELVNACDVAFVCVPTPSLPGGACDLREVEEVATWIATPLVVIRSTVPPGTTDRLTATHGRPFVFQPEYGPGETPGHPYADVRDIPFVILGGDSDATSKVAYLYQQAFSSNLVIRRTDAKTAELTKYMENAFLAMKVAFCNEFFDLAGGLGVDYHELRELWLLDERIGRSHTWVHPEDRGFGGRCLPKDLEAIVHTGQELGIELPVLSATRQWIAAASQGQTEHSSE